MQHTNHGLTRFALLIIGLLAGLAACSQPTVQSQSYLLRADQFSLETVVGLIQNGRATDAASLQTLVNDPSSGINNVDVDHDNQIDMVLVRETEQNGNKRFDFTAQPSGNPNGQPVDVATINFVRDGSQIAVNAGYANYVQGYDSYYYNVRLAQDLMLFHYLYAPHPYYVPVYSAYHYVPRPIYAPSYLSTVRRTYTTTTQISPIARTVRPSTFQTATRIPSAYQRSTFRAPATTISSTAGTSRGYNVSSPSVNSRQGTGFWSSSPRPTVSSPTISSRQSYGGGTFSRPSPSPSFSRPSFGGGSSFSRPSPSFSRPSLSSGGGGFRSSSFGGRRR